MKALTLHQPWATLVAEGVKTIETRSWPTKHRGPVAIHAAAICPWKIRRTVLGHAPRGQSRSKMGLGQHYIQNLLYNLRYDDFWPADTMQEMPLGAVIAVAELVDCIPMLAEDADLPYEPHLVVGREELVHRALDGCILGTPMVETHVHDQRPYGDFAPGRWAFMLADVRKLSEPVSVRGGQRLWNLPADVEAAVLEGVSA